MRTFAQSTVDSSWPLEEPGFDPEDVDYDTPLEFDDEYWEALVPDDDYEPTPEYGDFWPDEESPFLEEGCVDRGMSNSPGFQAGVRGLRHTPWPSDQR
jgi:hypothetical protein